MVRYHLKTIKNDYDNQPYMEEYIFFNKKPEYAHNKVLTKLNGRFIKIKRNKWLKDHREVIVNTNEILGVEFFGPYAVDDYIKNNINNKVNL